MREAEKKNTNTIWTAVLICMIALVCVTLAALAWFSIADNARLKGVNVDITTGKYLRFDLTGHETFEEYAETLSYEDIVSHILKERGTDIRDCALNPVTTADGVTYTYRNGTEADPGDYLEFDLHFMADSDMLVHLTSANGRDKEDGTKIMSDNPLVPDAMRIAFQTPDEVIVYDQGQTADKIPTNDILSFRLLPSEILQYNEDTVLFRIRAGEDVPVTVRIWVEGSDEACTNDIKAADFAVKLRFMGTDEEYQLFR